MSTTVWVLIWVASNYAGFVSKVDTFDTHADCVKFARDIQARDVRGFGSRVSIPGTPICVERPRPTGHKEST